MNEIDTKKLTNNKVIHVLHLLPAEMSDLIAQTCIRWQDYFNPERYRIHLALVAFDKTKPKRIESKIPIHYIDDPWTKGALQFTQLIKKLDIHILHTHLEPATSWAVHIAARAGVSLFAHNFCGEGILQKPSFGLKQFSFWIQKNTWKHFQKISLKDQSLFKLFQGKMPLSAHRLFVNPPAICDNLYEEEPLNLDKTISHYILHLEVFENDIVQPSKEFQRALKLIREQYPQTHLRFHKAKNLLPPIRSDKGSLHYYILLIEKRINETMFIRLMELIARGIPFFIVGHSSSTSDGHDLMTPLPMASTPHYHQNITHKVQAFFRDPREVFRLCVSLQEEAKKAFPLAQHCDLWKSRYEEMIEESLSKRVQMLQRPTVLGKHLSKPISDDEFFSFLRCAKCGHVIEADITEKKDGRAWHGSFSCDCGQRYPLLNGIPRIFKNAWDYFHDPKLNQRNNRLTPLKYWQKHFEKKPDQLKIHYRKILALLTQDLMQDDLVLGLQCGTGGTLFELIRHGVRGIGLDQGEHIETAGQYLWQYPQIRLVQGNPKNPPLQSHAFQVCYHAEATLNSQNPSEDINRWKKLLNVDGKLHLLAHELPNPDDERLYEWLTSFSHALPYPLVSGLAAWLATTESLKKCLNKMYASKGDFHALHSNWFRLLCYPDLNLTNARQLKIWAEKANLNDLRIRALKPWGYHLQGRP